MDINDAVKSSMDIVKGNNIVAQAKKEFPVLSGLDIMYKTTPKANSGFLEFWPGDESGTPEYPRPKEFPLGKAGVEIYDLNTRPIDVMGDVASHQLIYTDPKMKGYYQQFTQSMTPEQRARLQAQYEWAQKNENEQRPFEQWADRSGLPGYFRGYPFQQWDKADELYTPEQIKMFDEMMVYLRGK